MIFFPSGARMKGVLQRSVRLMRIRARAWSTFRFWFAAPGPERARGEDIQVKADE